jgi:hypothetical protein
VALFRLFPGLYERILATFEAAFERMALFADEPLSEATQRALASALGEFNRARDGLLSYEPLRPHVSSLLTVRSVLNELTAALDLYQDALTAEVPLQGQVLAKRAQSHIDRGAEARSLHEARHQEATTLGAEQSLDQRVLNIIELLASRYPDKDLLGFDAEGARQMAVATGADVASGSGTTYLSLKLTAGAFLDEGALDARLRAATQALDGGGDTLRDLGRNPSATGDLGAARVRLNEIFEDFGRLLAFEQSDERVFRRIVHAYGAVLEEVALPLLCWYLLASGTKNRPYERLKQDDVTSLYQSACASLLLEPIFAGGDNRLRHAASHGHSFKLEDDQAIFDLRSFGGTIPVDVVVDALLALIESLSAAFLALDNRCSFIGGFGPAPGLGPITFAEIARLWLRKKFGQVNLDSHHDSWVVEVKSLPMAPHELASTLLIAGPSTNTSVTVEVANLGEGHLRVPVEGMQAFLEPDTTIDPGLDAMSRTIALLRASNLNESPALDEAHLKGAVAILATILVGSGKAEVIPYLRACMRMATESGFSQLAQEGAEAIRLWQKPDQRLVANQIARLRPWIQNIKMGLPTVRNTTVYRPGPDENLVAPKSYAPASTKNPSTAVAPASAKTTMFR